MSERILKALMQLFAIIAHPQKSASERRNMVELYLLQHLDHETARDYLKIFDHHYDKNQKRNARKSSIAKYNSANSVRVLKICTQINEELNLRHKVIVLIQLLEFLKLEKEINSQEIDFIETMAETFFMTEESFKNLYNFIINPFNRIDDSSGLLTIEGKEKFMTSGKHMATPGLKGQIKILLLREANIFIMRYDGTTELYSNGQLMDSERVHLLDYGFSIRSPKISPIYYSDISSMFNQNKQKSQIVFQAKEITYRFNNKTVGIHNLSMTEKSGKLVGIIGSSGAGKTTLLNILNGSARPYEGQVLINGYNIHLNRSKLQGVIGYVSQDDLLIESLTVFENLYFNAKLCFADYSSFQLIRIVLKLLKQIGLYEVRGMKVGSPLDKKISGGERKRLNIALELIREPSVLFLDEPTSGLSSRDSIKIIDMLKDLTMKDKLVFVVIHQPSSDIFKMFDRLLVLDTGGYLIFNGNPIDAISYFKSQSKRVNRTDCECAVCGNINPDQILNIVESLVLDEYGNPTQTRKISPRQWNQFFQKTTTKDKILQKKEALPPVSFKIPSRFKQFMVFTRRDLLSKLSNTQYLFINLIETPLLAFILAFIIKFYNVNATNTIGYTFSNNSNLPVYLLISVIVALFIGLTVSAEEIIRDQKILKREDFLNLSRSSYLLSKVVILMGISAIQALLFTLIGNTIVEIKGMYFYYWLALFSSWCFANLLGLNISNSFKTVITIYILIPFLIIPQLILSGIIVKFDKINPNISSPNTIPWYGEIITARWAFEALAIKQYKDNRYQKNLYIFDKIMSQADYKKNYWLPILKRKLNEYERFKGNEQYQQKLSHNLRLLQKELGKASNSPSHLPYTLMDSLMFGNMGPATISATHSHINKLRDYYISLYNSTNRQKDQFITELQKSLPNRNDLVNLKRSYSNKSLTKLVRSSDELERIIEFDDQLYQKIDPVFLDPDNNFLKAHFYAPCKKFMGRYYDTYWINILVIWAMTLTLYITLYFNILKRTLNNISSIKNRLLDKYNKHS